MNFKNRLLIFLLACLFIPFSVFAYSNQVILGGDNIGIQINSKGVMIVGFYKVNGNYIGSDAGLEIGDVIITINDNSITNVEELVDNLDKSNKEININIGIIRNNKPKDIPLKLIKDDNNIYKTGIYVKDQISGIGTLTYLDPKTKIFGALGHEIIEKSSGKRLDILKGKIFKSEITNIERGSNGTPGEKTAVLHNEEILGNITKNTNKGIFGKYNDILENELIEVASKNEITLGKAWIRTVINGTKIDSFTINILKINYNNDVKNILFEITDQNLIKQTGGVIQGMSGSPIIQNEKLIGAVTHVIVNDAVKGYGIFIETMLEEGEN
ncbi:MAG: SpoIVB peptidase [Tenericutes bacterium]|nr:SpoIVB peptidase [Mycoplasmatota bacterium]